MIMEASQSKMYNVGQQTGDPEEPLVWMKSEGNLLEDSILMGEADLVLVWPSTDWTRPTQIMVGSLLPQSSPF